MTLFQVSFAASFTIASAIVDGVGLKNKLGFAIAPVDDNNDSIEETLLFVTRVAVVVGAVVDDDIIC
jgi:hypothetical protein